MKVFMKKTSYPSHTLALMEFLSFSSSSQQAPDLSLLSSLSINSLVLHLLQRLSSSSSSRSDQLEDEGSKQITGETGIIMMCLLAQGIYSLCFTNQTSEGISLAAHTEGELQRRRFRVSERVWFLSVGHLTSNPKTEEELVVSCMGQVSGGRCACC